MATSRITNIPSKNSRKNEYVLMYNQYYVAKISSSGKVLLVEKEFGNVHPFEEGIILDAVKFQTLLQAQEVLRWYSQLTAQGKGNSGNSRKSERSEKSFKKKRLYIVPVYP